MNKKDESHFVENASATVEIHVKDSQGEPLVKLHIDPNVEAPAPTSGKALVETTDHTVDIPMSDILEEINYASNELVNENYHCKEPEVHDQRNGEAEENDDQPLANLLEKINKDMSKGTQDKAKDLMVVDYNSEIKELHVIKFMKSIERSLHYEGKGK